MIRYPVLTEEQFLAELSALVPKMDKFKATASGSLTVDEVNILKRIYPTLVQLSGGHIKREFTASCSTCVIETFRIVVSVYDRLISNKKS